MASSRVIRAFGLRPLLYMRYNSRRPQSTEAAAKVEEKLPRFRTFENNPLQHSELHTAKFYTIPPNEKTMLFLTGGITREHDVHIEAFRECGVLIRSPALEVISYLKSYNYSFPALRIVIYGADGVGKTCTLMHLVHFGYKSNYLMLHIPWVSNWTKRPKEKIYSESRPGRIDLPVESVMWLQHFKAQNSHLLQKLDLKTSKTYVWSQRESTEEGQPLTEVLEHGLARGRHASDCIAVILKELKINSSSGKFRTLVIIDGVNAFYAKTNIKRTDKTLVKATDVTVVHAFEKMLNNDWNNAAVVVTVDTIIANKYESKTMPFTPRALLGKEGFEVLDPFIPVEVENYTDKELESVLDYYVDRMWVQMEEARSEEGRLELKFLSGNHPYTLRKLVDPL